MEPTRTAGTATLLAAAAAALAGCGDSGSKIDATRAASVVREQLLGPKPSSVDCPKGVAAKDGKSFGCTVIYADGTSATVTVHVLGGGRVSVAPGDYHPH